MGFMVFLFGSTNVRRVCLRDPLLLFRLARGIGFVILKFLSLKWVGFDIVKFLTSVAVLDVVKVA